MDWHITAAETVSLPARGVWIEIVQDFEQLDGHGSLPARGVWIEIQNTCPITGIEPVAPRKGSVD